MKVRQTKLSVETLLKIVLFLVAVLLVLEILGWVISGLSALLGPFLFLIQLAIAVLIVLWLLDRL